MILLTASPLTASLLRFLALILFLGPWSSHATSPSVELNGTTVTGTAHKFTDNLTVEFYGGIPFAKPPVGELRFAPPVEINGIGVSAFDATKFGAPCVQSGVEGVSEDCLTLNIFRPSESVLSNEDAAPVMVWISGLGFMEGVSSTFNASQIIMRSIQRGTPVVYVSINYRLGPFGFPQGSEADSLGSLNLGLKDQLAAISWVQKYIGAFGGDPTKITLFGQSAGSMSIATLYLNAGLENYGVRGAIMESGFAGSLPSIDASRGDLLWDAFAANVTVCAGVFRGSTFSCLRNATADALLSSWEAAVEAIPDLFHFVPVIDGPGGLLPDVPSNLLAAGNFSRIPFIAGTVVDEGTDFVPRQISSDLQYPEFVLIAEDPFPEVVTPDFQVSVGTLIALYPDDPAAGSPFGTGNETFGLSSQYKRASAMYGDVSFQAVRRRWIEAATAAGVTAYGYVFADQNVAVADPSKGVYHASEVPYIYDSQSVVGTNQESGRVSLAMVDHWLSFVVSGTPNDGKGSGRTTWPQYTPDNQVLIQFDTTNLLANSSNATFAVVADDYRAQQISAINSVAAALGS
ncbi:hypothetical protein GSI_12175 [Ganoderma sinense ZZ0214-1]|uniref:Carboxylic ester hydrolase n=1 Tax=Ganoderma sinense ZZ0214-1 TaxID=1077348 RepID=A0A2G8RYM1_9APHY|nr:hypothetical protein GSI_12175 [Ganoderma sinense ZZ0214-1]